MASVEIDVLVIGAGVSGLTTAICLAERGLSVLVLARELPAETYSNAAGAMWGPCLADHERVPEWSRETLAVLKNLAEEPGTGVALLDGLEASRDDEEPPDWLTEIGYAECPPKELPGDADVVPVRGQLVVVENPGIDMFFGECSRGTNEPTYFIPHGAHVVLGSTLEPGRADTDYDAAAAAAIVRRCAAVAPALHNAPIVTHRVW